MELMPSFLLTFISLYAVLHRTDFVWVVQTKIASLTYGCMLYRLKKNHMVQESDKSRTLFYWGFKTVLFALSVCKLMCTWKWVEGSLQRRRERKREREKKKKNPKMVRVIFCLFPSRMNRRDPCLIHEEDLELLCENSTLFNLCFLD